MLGIGNILWADEGFGVRAVEAFDRRYAAPPNVTILDGGTQGLYLVHHVADADCLLVFDAIDYGLEPGTLKLVEGEEVPKFTGAKKMSLHQTGFQEVLSAADLLGKYPEKIALIGCQPLDLEDWGGPLTEPGPGSDRAGACARGRGPARLGRRGRGARGRRTTPPACSATPSISSVTSGVRRTAR